MNSVVLLWTSLIILGVSLLVRLHQNRVSKYVNQLPGPISLPFIGTAYLLLFIPKEDLFRKARQNIGKYGELARSWLGNIPVVHISTAENAEIVLRNSENISKSFLYDSLLPWLGEGLLTSTGTKWQRHRKLITPTFHFKILENFMDVFVEKSKLLASQLGEKANGDIFDVYPYITHCALDIICETAMGVQMNAMLNKDNEYVKAIYGISTLIFQRMTKPWLHRDFIFWKTSKGKQYKKHLHTLHSTTEKVIEERKQTISTNLDQTSPCNEEDINIGKKTKMAFLDLLIEASENGKVLTDRQIREEVDTFMFEGHDTTTAAICWTLFLLGNHTEIQDEVYEEINKLFQGEDKNLTINDLGELKLLERCIKEAHRLYPSVPVIARRITEDIQIGQYLIPVDATISMHIYLIHRDKKYFSDPDIFNPDRFLPENTKNRHPYAYIPFSAGPRNCIGQKFAMYEEKTVLAYMLRKFKVKAIENQETIRPMMEVVLRPLNGVKIVLEPRK